MSETIEDVKAAISSLIHDKSDVKIGKHTSFRPKFHELCDEFSSKEFFLNFSQMTEKLWYDFLVKHPESEILKKILKEKGKLV